MPEGVLYYVSPYVAGGSLRDRLLREQRLPVPDALRIAREVAQALDYAHRNGFVHRDVKPENILFADGQAVLADFGVARAYRARDADSDVDAVTEAGFALGTPAYMSPEQASGDRELGAPSDVYSLACVVYEMLAGTPPLVGAQRAHDDRQAGDGNAAPHSRAATRGPARRPSRRSPARWPRRRRIGRRA